VKAMWIEDPSGEFDIGEKPVALYAAVLFAALGTLLLLPGFGPVVETAQASAAALFA